MAGFALRGPCKLCRMQATSALPQRTYTTLARSFPTLLAIYRAPLLGSRSCTLTRLALLLLCKAFSLFRYWQYLILACLCQVLFSAFRKIFFASFFLPPFPIVTGSISYLLACVKCFFGIAKNFFSRPRQGVRRGLENSLDFSSNCLRLPRPRASTGRAGGARGEGRPRPKDR